MADIRIDHAGKHYVLKPKTITGEVIDLVTPIRQKMKEHSQTPALIEAALEDDQIFSLVDVNTGNLREGVTQEQIIELTRTNRKLMKVLAMPTVNLTTDPQGRKLMAELIQVTVDRGQFSKELSEDIDSQHFTKVTPQQDIVEMDEEGNEIGRTPQEPVVVEATEFWKQFPVDVMIEYTETFCKRARI
jgi:hypothetical protein